MEKLNGQIRNGKNKKVLPIMKINIKRKPDYNRMVELLNYNSDTGIFTRKVSKGGKSVGSVAGGVNPFGHILISIGGKLYMAHRLAIYYIHKYWPENEIDHINRDPSDNRIVNLREVSTSCNLRNTGNFSHNRSGVKGVSWSKKSNKWYATIKNNNKQKSLGLYKSKTEAVFARYAGEQALGWKGCDKNSPAYRYVCNTLGRSL